MRERDPGIWELRVYVGRDSVTGKPRQKSKTHRGGKRDAETELAKMVTEVATGALGGTNATVSVLLDRWLKDVERTASPATLAVYRDSVRSHLKPGLGHIRVNRLNAGDLDALYGAMKKAGRSVYVVRQCHSAIRAALEMGVRYGWVTVNVGKIARPPKLPHNEVTAPTGAEMRQLVLEIEKTDPDLAYMVLLAGLTGCRRGELCALRWADWDGDRLHVRRRLVEAGGHVSEQIWTKGGGSKDIVIDEIGVATLKNLLALQRARAKEAGTKLPKNGYLLSYDGLGGSPRRPKNVSGDVRSGFKAIGLPDFHLHSCRHFSATELVADGMDVRTVAARLGHSDPALTLRVYSHVVEAREREAASVLGRALTP